MEISKLDWLHLVSYFIALMNVPVLGYFSGIISSHKINFSMAFRLKNWWPEYWYSHVLIHLIVLAITLVFDYFLLKNFSWDEIDSIMYPNLFASLMPLLIWAFLGYTLFFEQPEVTRRYRFRSSDQKNLEHFKKAVSKLLDAENCSLKSVEGDISNKVIEWWGKGGPVNTHTYELRLAQGHLEAQPTRSIIIEYFQNQNSLDIIVHTVYLDLCTGPDLEKNWDWCREQSFQITKKMKDIGATLIN